MRLAPGGEAYVCGPNWTHSLGNVTGAGLGEIWHGARATQLRTALSHADFSLGCDECAADALGPLRATTHAGSYDGYPVDRPEWPRRMEFALSNVCNLQCVQCNGELSSAIRSQREGRTPLRSPYDERFFEELADFLPHLDVADFLGGEPFLSRSTQRVWDMLLAGGHTPLVQVTTNATVWNDKVEHYLRSLRMDVTVSMDGVSAETNDAIRIGSSIDTLRAVRDRIVATCSDYGGRVIINHCLMPQNWHELPEFLLEAEHAGLPVYVCRVVTPSSHSMLALGREELEEVVTTLRREEPAVRGALRVNGDVWDRTVSMLEAQLERKEGFASHADGTPVVLQAAGAPDDRIDRAAALLAEWSERPVLRLHVVDGHVRTAEVPDWAVGLSESDWTGLELTELTPAFERLTGATLGSPTSLDMDGVQVMSLEASGGAALEVRAGLIPWGGPVESHLMLLVATSRPLDAPPDDAERR